MIESRHYEILKRYLSGWFYDERNENFDQMIEYLKHNYQESMTDGSELDRSIWEETKQALEIFLGTATDEELQKLVTYIFNFRPNNNREFIHHLYHRIFVDSTPAQLLPQPVPPTPTLSAASSVVDRSGFKEKVNKNEYEWVEIPNEKFITGISELQVKTFQQHIRAEQRYNRLTPREQSLLESAVAKLWDKSKGKLSQEEEDVVGSPYKSKQPETPAQYIYEAEVIFKHIPKEEAHSLDTFYITRFPVTSHQLHPFEQSKRDFKMGESTELFDPAIVHWRKDVEAFCSWAGARLPSPLEWEKAARGPNGLLYPWGNEWNPKYGNFVGEKGIPGHPSRALATADGWATRVNAFPQGASPYGVMDMAGNVREFTSQEGVAKAKNARYANKEYLWVEHLLARETSDVTSGPKDALCFRLVLDHWNRHLWPGYRPSEKKNGSKE